MRIRTLALFALLALPAGSSAQLIRPPRTGRGGTTVQPTPLPPEAAPVSRALAYRRSRWSTEGYSLINSLVLPTIGGGSTRTTTYGAGTRAAYRYSDQFSATIDLTASMPGGLTTSQTAEAGTRFSPLGWDHSLRPFVDVRAAYMNLLDTFTGTLGSVGAANQQYVNGSRYSRGFGGLGGTGLEYSLTNSLAIATEISALQTRMTTYRVISSGDIPRGSTYWMTSYRLSLGLRFNPVRAIH